VWRIRGGELPLDRTLLMGVVNATPDSFSDGGAYDPAEQGERLAAEGADVLDVGGESTRPGALAVPADEEARRVLPVVRRLAAAGRVVSIDTGKARVARDALAAGARIVNDVTAGADPEMFPLVAREGAGIVLVHMQGEPRTMQRDPRYEDVVKEVAAFLLERARAAEAAGVPRACLAIDPGIGFGKTTEHNLELLRHLDEIKRLGYPVLVGASRKAFLGKLTAAGGEAPGPQDRLEATLAAHALAAANGADVIRAHDVREHRRALAVVDAWIGSR
jgi:dihydropteroate synthase